MEQHIQVPRMHLKEEGLITIDPYVYACIKKFMNSETKEAFPSNKTLIEVTGLASKTIIASTNRLEAAGYISIKRELGKPNIYTFNDYKQFEIFSYDFLDNPDLSPKEKSYLVASQQYMFKNADLMQGKITFSSEKLAEAIGLSLNTLRKYENTLKSKEILTTQPIKRDNSHGLAVEARYYYFEKALNIIACKFLQQDQKIEQNTQDIRTLQQTIAELQRRLDAYENEGKKKIIL